MFSSSSNMWLEEAELDERMADIARWVEQSVAGVHSSARASLEQKEWTPDFFIPSHGESSTAATPGTFPARAGEDDDVFGASTSGNRNKPKKNKTKKFRRSHKKGERSKPNTPSNDYSLGPDPFGTEGEPSSREGCESANDTSTEDEADNSHPQTLELFKGLDLDEDLNYMPGEDDEPPMALWDLLPLSVLKEVLTDAQYEATQKKFQETVIEPSVTPPCQQSTHANGRPLHTEDCVKKCGGCDLFYLKCIKPCYSKPDASEGAKKDGDIKDKDGNDKYKMDADGDEEDKTAQCPVCGWRDGCDERDDICRITGEILHPSQE